MTQSVNLINWIPSLIATGALGFVWYDIRRFKKDIWNAIYDDNGAGRFVSRDDCETHTSKCPVTICKKVDELKVVQKEASNKQEVAWKSNDEKLGSIGKTLTTVTVIQKLVLQKHGLLDDIDLSNV
jgi:hypothetical protein